MDEEIIVDALAVICPTPCNGVVITSLFSITSDYRLMIEGLCVKCRTKIIVFMTINELQLRSFRLKRRNLRGNTAVRPPLRRKLLPPTISDSTFLKAMGIEIKDE